VVRARLAEVNPAALDEIEQAIIELRAPIEHQTLLAGLMYHELPEEQVVERLVNRSLKSWRARWLGQGS